MQVFLAWQLWFFNTKHSKGAGKMKITTVEEYAQQAKESMLKLRDFGYSGELDLIRCYNPTGVWAFSRFSVCRDSDALERSNWEIISGDLLKKFPSLCEVLSTGHWAVGWLNHLVIRLYDKAGKTTPVVEACFEWHERLENYIVADEEHFSNLEWEEITESMEDSIHYAMRKFLPTHSKEDEEKVFNWLKAGKHFDRAFDREGWYEDAQVLEALTALGYKIKE
jgi:hypothetical protein